VAGGRVGKAGQRKLKSIPRRKEQGIVSPLAVGGLTVPKKKLLQILSIEKS
jgi:hypothetical protein